MCIRDSDRVDGCACGMTIKSLPVYTRWTLATDSMYLVNQVAGLRCGGGHAHIVEPGRCAYLDPPAAFMDRLVRGWLKKMARRQTMAAPLRPSGDAGEAVPAMPTVPHVPVHNDQDDPIRKLHMSISAVAKVLTKSEIQSTKAAQDAMAAEFNGLQQRGTWSINKVRSKRAVIELSLIHI